MEYTHVVLYEFRMPPGIDHGSYWDTAARIFKSEEEAAQFIRELEAGGKTIKLVRRKELAPIVSPTPEGER